jgi:uncharacterized protein (TIGR03437 family)
MYRYLMLLFALWTAALPLAAQTQDSVTVNIRGPYFIPDDYYGTRLRILFTVNKALIVNNVEMTLNLPHPRLGDLKIDLINPYGRSRRFADQNCGDARNFLGATFDGKAPQRYGDVCPPSVQRFAPREDMTNWSNDENSFGVWALEIEDDADGNAGYFDNATITISGINQANIPYFEAGGVRDAASLVAESVTPGELVLISGSGLGPTDLVVAPVPPAGGKYSTTLAGTSVFFDSIAAPIRAVVDKAVLVQVPWELGDRDSTTIVIRANGQSSRGIVVDNTRTRPGIYTAGNTGVGQAQVINQNGSVNSSSNRAPKGSVVAVYMNGGGSVLPTQTTGAVTPNSPLSYATLPVRAFVGDREARVLFAGLAPGTLGAFQVNVEIPPNAPSGALVSLSISVDGRSTQNGVTIAVQ